MPKALCSCSRGFLPTTLETQSPNVESSDRKNELLWQSKKCCKMQKKVVKNVAFLYQTTPARLNAADCPFNPTSTMPLNSMWLYCALPSKLLLTFDFDCFVPFLLFCSTPPALCHSLSCGSIVYYQEDYY